MCVNWNELVCATNELQRLPMSAVAPRYCYILKQNMATYCCVQEQSSLTRIIYVQIVVVAAWCRVLLGSNSTTNRKLTYYRFTL